MLIDQYGRALQSVPVAELLERQAVPSTGSVRQIQSGHPADGLNPVRLASILREAETGDATAYLELAEQMEEKDLHYAAVLGVRKRAIRALELHVDPGDDTEAAGQLAEMTRAVLNSTAVRTSLIDMMDALGKGFSVCEILWERDGRDLRITDIASVLPTWFEFDRENGRHLYLRDNDGPQPLRPDTFIVHMAQTKSGLPIRGGLARLAAWAYMFKNFTLKDWAIFCEAYGHPLRLGRYESTATPADRQTLLRAVRQIGVDMAAIIPKSMEVDVVNGATTGAEKLYEGNARYWDEQVSKGVLGQTATTDAIAGGHAVGRIHENVRDDIRDADAEQLAATLQRDIAGPLRRLRFPAKTRIPLPSIRFAPKELVDPKLLLELAKEAPALGIRVATADIYRAFAISRPDDDEEVISVQPPALPPVNGRPDTTPEAERQAASLQSDAARDSIDALVDELIEAGDMQRAAEADLGPLIEAVRRASDFDELRDVLHAFIDSDPGALRELLTRSTYAARLAGEVGAPIQD